MAETTFSATGRRKEAVARVSLKVGGGVMTINNRSIEDYLKRAVLVDIVNEPMKETDTLGKRSGADQLMDKSTYPMLFGLTGAKQRARELHEEAMESLAGMDEKADPLRWISAYTVERDR